MLPQPEKDNTPTEDSSIHKTTSSSVPPLSSSSTRTRTTSGPGFVGQSQIQQQAQPQQTSRRRNVSTGSSSESAVTRRISSSSSAGLGRHPQHYHPRGRTSSSTSAAASAVVGESSSSLSSPPSLIEWLSKNKKEKTRKKQQQQQKEDHHKKTDEGSSSHTTVNASSTFDIKHDPGGSSIASNSNNNALNEHQQVVTNITRTETPDTTLSVGLVRRSLVEEEGGGNDISSTIFVTPKKKENETDNKTDVRFRSGGDGKSSNSTTSASSILPHHHDCSNSTALQPQHVRRKNDKRSQEKKDKRKLSFQQVYKRPSSPPMIGNTLSGSNGTSSSLKQCIFNYILSCLLEKPFSRLLTQCIIVFVLIEVLVWQWTTKTLLTEDDHYHHPLHHTISKTTTKSKHQGDDHQHHSVVHVLMSSFQKKKEYHHHRNRIKEAESTPILLSLFDVRNEKWEHEAKKKEENESTTTRKTRNVKEGSTIATVEETNNQRERRTSTTTPEEVHSAIYDKRRTFIEHHINNQQHDMPPFHIRTSPNYGGIEFSSIAPPRDDTKHPKSMISDMPGTLTSERGRIIYHSYREGVCYDDHHHKRSIEEDDTILRSEFAFDDDMIRGKHVGERHSHHHHHNHNVNDEPPTPHCVRPSWYRDMYPSCNNFHELDFIADEGMLLGKGHYKVAYEFDLVPFTSEKVVMKAMNFKKHEFDIAIIENSRMESLIMERLSSSPRVVNIYGMCGTSTLLEHMPNEIKEPMLWQGEGYASEEDIENCEQHIQQVYQKESGSTEPDPSIMCPTSNEEWSPTHKLQMALHMAEALAYVHGYVGGVMVHDDIKIGQYLMNSKGEIKLNDFNRGEIMFYDIQRESYCKYRNGYVNGIHRAPEENSNSWLNEQIDVYSLGNIYYSLLTGLWNFYTYEDDEVVQQKVIDGDLPYLDPRYETRSYAEKALKEVIEYTLIYDASKRPSIFQVVKFLRERVERNEIKERKAKRRTIGR